MDQDQRAIIKACRDEITALDQEIFMLVKKREQLSSQIGHAKRGLNIPDRDLAREKAVFDHAMNMAKTLDLPQSLASALQQLIINVSLSRQERDRIKNNLPEEILNIAIVGGSGRMGGWFSHFLADSGHTITVVDKQRPDFEVAYSQDLGKLAPQSDLIIIATPIRTSVLILEQLKQMKLRSQIIFDLSSVKAPVYKVLSALRDQGALVTSLHPMFGPSVQLLFGKHVILTSMGVNQADKCARDLFKSTALTVLEMSIDEHDKTMAYVLSLSHLINIIFALALEHSGLSIANLERLGSPTFSQLLSQSRKVLEENPHLYYEIQALNSYNKKSYEVLSKALKKLLDAVRHDQEDIFVEYMKAGQKFLGKIS